MEMTSNWNQLVFFTEVQAGHRQRTRTGRPKITILTSPQSPVLRRQVMGRKLVDQVVFAKK